MDFISFPQNEKPESDEMRRKYLAQMKTIDRHVGLPLYPSGTRPKGDGIVLSPFLKDGVVEFPATPSVLRTSPPNATSQIWVAE